MYTDFIRVHPTPVWLTDLDTLLVVDSNQAAWDLFGRHHGTPPQMTLESVSAPDDLPHLPTRLDRVRRREAFSDVCRLMTKSFGPADMVVSWMPVDLSGHPHILNIIHENSALNAAREQLRASNDLLRIAGSLAQVGGWRIDPVEELVHITEQTAAILEMPGLKTMPIDGGVRYLAPEYQQQARDMISACLQDGTPYDEIVYLVTATGKRVCVRTVGVPIRDDDGRISGAQGAFQNVEYLTDERSRAALLANRLQRTLGSMGEGFIALDPGLHIDYLNPRAEEMLGHRQDVVKGMHLADLRLNGSASSCLDAATRVAEQNVGERMDCFFVPNRAWYRLHLLPTPDGVAIYFHDVTVEKEHAKHLSLLEAAIQVQHDMLEIYEVGEAGEESAKLIYVNQAFERITGYKSEEIIGKSLLFHNGTQTVAKELGLTRPKADDGTEVKTETAYYRKDGSTYLKEADLRTIRDGSGKITHWVATSRDITARRAAEEALHASEERFRLVAQATHDVIWDHDVRLGKTWWSEAFFKVFGHDSAAPEVKAREWWVGLVHPQDVERVVSGMTARFASRDNTWEAAYRLRRGDGSYAYVTDRAYMSRDAGGNAFRIVGCMADVTAQVELTSRIRRDQKLEGLRQLTGGIAHDFNNLLTVIIGNSELLAEDPQISQDHALMAEKVLLAAERGSLLTSELLSFAREQALVPTTINLNALLENIVPTLQSGLSEKHKLHIIPGADLGPIKVDLDQMEASILALVQNSIDAMPSGGTLTIETRNAQVANQGVSKTSDRNAKSYVQLSVRDTGHGISPEHIERVFEPFFTTRPTGKGKGLGLSVIHGFVQQCGGYLEVEAAPGKGAAFHLFFPLTQFAMSACAMGQHRSCSRGGEHILLVEDDPMVSTYVRGQIERLGYRVTVADNADEALGLLKVHSDINLLFTDVVMPGGINGWQLSEIVADQHPEVKVLLTSGYTDAVFAEFGISRPDVRILEKPYRRQELEMNIRAALDR